MLFKQRLLHTPPPKRNKNWELSYKNVFHVMLELAHFHNYLLLSQLLSILSVTFLTFDTVFAHIVTTFGPLYQLFPYCQNSKLKRIGLPSKPISISFACTCHETSLISSLFLNWAHLKACKLR